MSYQVGIMNSIKGALIDRFDTSGSLEYRPQFVFNNYKDGKKVLANIEAELLCCDEFSISVAFITVGGITPLLQTFKELEKKGVKGRILTTDYLCFSEPRALKMLNELNNIEIRMYKSDVDGFHTKGYIFKKDEIYRIIVGSSNMTQSALTKNKEWNTRIVSTENGAYAFDIMREFEGLWTSDYTLQFDDFIESYEKTYRQKFILEKVEKINYKIAANSQLIPNKMQSEFITNYKRINDQGENKALLISATGTGKTYASAFAMRELKFKKVLFLVHRNQIAKQALESFKKVFNSNISMGLVTGGYHDYDCDFIFATIQTMSKDENMKKFDSKHFDAIIIDEAHHSSANSYKKILDYFKPISWLGMTATPDKRDDDIEGRNIYEIFNHQIAYEIRLQNAMEEDLLCPFHYFGITDLEVVSDLGKSVEEQVENFRYLTSDQRVENVMRHATYFGYSGDRVKGLIFCSRVDEAKELSQKFNQRGWRTVVLTGADSEEVRTATIERLAGEQNDNALDYIVSVDIFSEGVDVPEINQVIMLRPTQSPIVFVQQLGRGLRKSEGKEFVVVLDFIGNYKNNFMIPIALSGDRTYNKDNLRRYVVEGGRVIPGSSTVHFDEISRKRIFKAIDDANFTDSKLIKENYYNLKNKLGHIPALMDFDKYGEMDVLRIFDNKSYGSYYKFLVKTEKSEYKIRLSEEEEKVIEFISKKFASGKRIHELLLLKQLLNKKDQLITSLDHELNRKELRRIDRYAMKNIVNILTNEFPTGTGKDTYKQCVFITEDENGDYKASDFIGEMLNNPDFKAIYEELVNFGISRYYSNYSNSYQDTNLVLYQKYTYEDVCRLLNWEKSEVPLNIGGYKYDKTTKTFPVFINYDKNEGISDTTNYNDHFITYNRLIAISKSGRNKESEDVLNFVKAKERGIDVHLFVRKNNEENTKEFYYLGRMTASGFLKEFTMPNTNKTAVEIEWILDTPVREDIYDYIVNG